MEELEVMDYVQAALKNNIEQAAEISFDCIQCGLCATRCMGEMAQYHIAQMVRRIRGARLAPPSKHCDEMVEQIRAGRYKECLGQLKSASEAELKRWFETDTFAKNPIGVEFDVQKLALRYEQGDPIEELLQQGAA